MHAAFTTTKKIGIISMRHNGGFVIVAGNSDCDTDIYWRTPSAATKFHKLELPTINDLFSFFFSQMLSQPNEDEVHPVKNSVENFYRNTLHLHLELIFAATDAERGRTLTAPKIGRFGGQQNERARSPPTLSTNVKGWELTCWRSFSIILQLRLESEN